LREILTQSARGKRAKRVFGAQNARVFCCEIRLKFAVKFH
jgi:hypothetical protein